MIRLLDGPPFCSGTAHIGSAYNKILKDVYLRLCKFKGNEVKIIYGWDMHGLPIELTIILKLFKLDSQLTNVHNSSIYTKIYKYMNAIEYVY